MEISLSIFAHVCLVPSHINSVFLKSSLTSKHHSIPRGPILDDSKFSFQGNTRVCQGKKICVTDKLMKTAS